MNIPQYFFGIHGILSRPLTRGDLIPGPAAGGYDHPMIFGLNIFWLLLVVVGLFSLALGRYLKWDNLPESKMATLDPDRLADELINDESLTEQERAYMKEVATLELTRRHLVC